MEIFVELVIKKAQIGTFKVNLGLDREQVMLHMKNFTFYKSVTELSKQIRELLKDENSTDEVARLRAELNSVVEKWKNGQV